MKTMDDELAADYEKTSSNPDFFDKYQAKKKKVEQLMEKWESVSIELESYS